MLCEQKGDFWTNRSVDELANAQGITPTQAIAQLRTADWPVDESLEEFVTTWCRWRQNAGLPLF